jgi:hypothetical protein
MWVASLIAMFLCVIPLHQMDLRFSEANLAFVLDRPIGDFYHYFVVPKRAYLFHLGQ